MKRTMIYIPEPQWQELTKRAKKEKQSMASQIREAIEHFLHNRDEIPNNWEHDPIWQLDHLLQPKGLPYSEAEKHDELLAAEEEATWKKS